MIPAMIFCNASWMKFYRGEPKNDPPKRGGQWVEENGWDHAMFNFLPFRGRYYGFVQAKSGRLNLERVRARLGSDKMEGVCVVWIATSPHEGAVIVGWYKNATLLFCDDTATTEND